MSEKIQTFYQRNSVIFNIIGIVITACTIWFGLIARISAVESNMGTIQNDRLNRWEDQYKINDKSTETLNNINVFMGRIDERLKNIEKKIN